jgi:hypothetical protein
MDSVVNSDYQQFTSKRQLLAVITNSLRLTHQLSNFYEIPTAIPTNYRANYPYYARNLSCT